MIPIHLSTNHPRWTPETEEELQGAIDMGLLEESHYLDLKEALASKSDNRETARDLASFAIDGGTLIIGIAEDTASNVFSLAPQPLVGLPEKIEQIARNTPDPPLNVLTDSIPSTADPQAGYLIVHIPASPSAPHMVDGRYYGRGDKTKHRLADPEVLLLHERRRIAEKDALAMLQYEMERDPIPDGEQAHFFFVAHPLAARRDMLKDLVSGDWNLQMAHLIQKAYTPELNTQLGQGVVPPITYASTGYRVSRGAARATNNLSNGRKYTPNPSTSEIALELQVHENGGMRLYSSRLSEALHSRPNSDEQFIYENAAVDLTRRMLVLIHSASENAGYFGNWALAVGVTKLRGLRIFPYHAPGSLPPEARYEEDTYQETSAVTWAELNSTPGEITHKLIGPLLRALDAEHLHTKLLQD
ncbi:hypothetical protein GCM10010441_29730 [Kitasatospora paracochleata]|uniref:Schlafen AlbA-2 domain-containing protein n=1 Tax=Kitasatospora paracochleata TaxID=58354 RepID=A0ABT1J905_9ACTN|nr:ATP-binding protein [Kitasatospora paracochleata]MCP2313932.1 hypothetical protein [Kitasatospora paracochleata]